MQNAEWPEAAPQSPQMARILHSAFFLLHSRLPPALFLEENGALA